VKIVKRSALILDVDIDDSGADEVASRARGTPRIANNLLRRVRDYAQVRANNFIDRHVADKALEMLEIDKHGLDDMDKRILETIIHKFAGGPVGLSNIAVSVGEEPDTIEEVYEPYLIEEPDTIEEVYEPYLIQEGYMARTPKGRVVTALCYQRFGMQPLPVRTGGQPELEL